ncbi:MAG: hypothetical protein KUA41_00190 [Hoeflea sp.]|uniref:hypothetical protein n=2 Tax=Hoeflea sp. TaxID=1940281 RepID=UPI0025BB4821|nr:hypothetical protein [Hoeflea sp.]MBV1759523.1 hypothetical protein [Hoeflea sp.]
MDSADSQMDHSSQGSDEARRRVVWRASALALFLPGLVVAGGYAAVWLFLYAAGRGEGALARVCLVVLVIGVPLILAYAGLRLSTLGLTLRGAHLEAHPGFPARDPVIVAYPAVTGLSIKRGLSGWLTGAGSMVIERKNGPTVVVAGLADPEGARADLSVRLAALGVRMSRA